MPIRDENKARYPKDWPAISKRVRDRAGQKCEGCGVENGRMIYRGYHENRVSWRYANDEVYMPSRCAMDGTEIPGTSWDDFKVSRGTVKVILTVAHLDHTPENCADENLRAWCQRCHNVYDAPIRRAGIKARSKQRLAVSDLFGDPTD